MGGGASASTAAKYKAGELSDEGALKALAELSDEDKSQLRMILEAPQCDVVATNAANVNANKAKLYELEGTVLDNKTRLYAERGAIEENRALILSNYSAAFMDNQQMANQNTDAIFRNKMELLKLQLKDAVDPVQKNYLQSRLNLMRTDCLRHRIKVNSRLAKVNEMMDKVNATLNEVNDEIMTGNEEIVEFNTRLFSTNPDASEASRESNAERITSNATSVDELTQLANTNIDNHKVMESVKNSREMIVKNSDKILERRKKIEENNGKVGENTKMVATLIGLS